MAITRSFGGQTLLKPGAYSVSRVDNAQSLNVGDNDTIMLIGEATNGTSSNSVNGEGTSRVFNSANVQSLVDYYVSGDLVDAALAAVRPSITAGVSGPGQFVVYKTNVGALSRLTSVFLNTTLPMAGDFLRFSVPVNASNELADVDLIWGQDISFSALDGNGAPIIPARVVTSAEDVSNSVLAAVLASPALQNFITPEETALAELTFNAVKQGTQFNQIRMSAFTAAGGVAPWVMSNVEGGFLFSAGTTGLGTTTTSQLNEAYSDAFNFDPNVIVPLWSNASVATSVSPASASFTAGGTGFTTDLTPTVEITNLTGTTSVQLTLVVGNNNPGAWASAFVLAWNASADTILSQYTASSNGSDGIITITSDAAGAQFNISSLVFSTLGTVSISSPVIVDDVLLPIQPGNPNAGTTFEFIDAQIAATGLQSHLIQRSSTSVRKEAQGMIGGRFIDWTTSYKTDTASINAGGFGGITSFLIQAFIQDVRVINSLGALEWKAPHILAAQAAGIRLGTTVGEPLTFKFVNAIAVAHHVNTSTGNFSGSVQFKPGFDFNVAIQNGITFTELASGGNRVVVDNTRYVNDGSFIFNRGSVIEAAQFVAKSSRQLLERIFVGNKVSGGAALSLKNVLRNYLIELNTDNIITSSSDAPFGFVEDTFTVSINGNTAEIQVEIKPVQGLDFIFINFTLGNITQQA